MSFGKRERRGEEAKARSSVSYVNKCLCAAKGEAEEKLRVLNNDLETRVAKRTKDLERISRALREREVLSVLGTAVAEIVHEIANHVLAISLATDLLERQFRKAKPADDEGLEDLREIAEETGRLELLIAELRNISRPLRIKFTTVRLDGLIAEAITAVQLIQKDRSPIKVEREFKNDLPSVMGDRERLREVFVNLIKNAFEAMLRGGDLIVLR